MKTEITGIYSERTEDISIIFKNAILCLNKNLNQFFFLLKKLIYKLVNVNINIIKFIHYL